ncbi:MAG: glycerate kinase [Duncaniella sp.]|nr:glycerate kinase [Duncaniella sp.]
MITILIAPDKFKGTLSAREAADIIAHELLPLKARLIIRPMADGGEGSSEAIAELTGMETRHTDARNSAMEPIPGGATYHFNPSTRTAAIDSSAVLGLGLLKDGVTSPLHRSSYPLGEALLSIIRKDSPTLLYIGIGGTSTVDGGAGFLEALGFRFFSLDCELPHPVTADMLSSITRIIPPQSNIGLPHIIALSDVSVPLVADTGNPSSLTFAPQKGATPAEINSLRESLRHLSTLLPSTGGKYDGAGGGLGYALAAIGAEMVAGSSYLLDMMDIPSISPDIIITGEGSLDSQTELGKAVAALADYGTERDIPVIAVGGRVTADFSIPGLAAVFSTQLYPPCGCLNYRTARARLSNASRDIRLWIEQRYDTSHARHRNYPNI